MQYTIEEYFEKLKKADWRYAYADDMGAWEKGKKQVEEVEWIAEKQPELKPMLQAVGLFLNGQRNRPTLDEFI